jgi:3,4-dihydroxy 2-butanone 4-phosphate synthase / GTP cyclohydrolase II
MKSLIKHMAEANLPTKHGNFKIHVFEDKEGKEHVALVSCTISKKKPTLVRIHSECLTGDTLGSKKCDCGEQLALALKMIAKEGGVLVYLQQEGRGIGLANKIKAYALQEEGYDTVEANKKLGFKDDSRDYTVGAQILAYLGVGKIKLLTNNPRKIEGLTKYKLGIVERVPMKSTQNIHNKDYLKVKETKLGHLFENKGVIR